MKLSKLIIERLLSDLKLRLKLALILNIGEETVKKHCTRNNKNNKITSVASINFLKKETGLKQSDLLIEETVLA